ncbi:hypothetical protein AB0N98_18920 [Streptomyces sp. NPDC093681]|uniref:hypothetical protein n=1 Tax=Streptomyces sp. NPDC093681 TaxID=3155202 RepID=UPI0034141412
MITLLVLVTTSACDAGSTGNDSGKGLDLGSVSAGWGPDRPTFTEANRPDRATLNSVTDNPRHGDERNFLSVTEVATGQRHVGGDVTLQPGQTYEATVFFRNDADPGTQAASTGTRVRATLPATVKGRERISAFLQSDNAEPTLLWQSLALAAPADSPVVVRIVPDSARVYTEAIPKGVSLPTDELFSEAGTLIGCSAQDGVLTGARQCEGRVQFRFVADQPNFVISQAVSRAGETSSSDLRFEPGTRVTFKMHYRNTGTTQQDNVVLRSELPASFRYVSGSAHVSTPLTDNKWEKAGDGITEDGLNLGSYAPDGGAYVKFTAVLPGADDVDCGLTSTTTTALARTANGTKSVESVILVEKKCG